MFKADGSSAGFVNDAGKVFFADGTAAGFMNGTKAFKMSGACVGSISEGDAVLGAALLLLFSVSFLFLSFLLDYYYVFCCLLFASFLLSAN